jgi:hypothetical protein
MKSTPNVTLSDVLLTFNSAIGVVFTIFCAEYKLMFWSKSTALVPKFFVRVPPLATKTATDPHILAHVTIDVRMICIQKLKIHVSELILDRY